jgi:hypothetical protein
LAVLAILACFRAVPYLRAQPILACAYPGLLNIISLLLLQYLTNAMWMFLDDEELDAGGLFLALGLLCTLNVIQGVFLKELVRQGDLFTAYCDYYLWSVGPALVLSLSIFDGWSSWSYVSRTVGPFFFCYIGVLLYGFKRAVAAR